MQITEIKLDDINDPTFQPRDQLEAEGIEALANSISELGLLNPIIVRKAEEGYELIAGTRRWHAFKLLGKDTIPAKIIEGDTRESVLLQFTENFHRLDLNPIQQAKMLKFMLEDLQYSTIEIAKFCNKSKEWVSHQLTLLDLEESTQDAIQAGQLSPSVAQELKLIPDPAVRSTYMTYAIQGGCTERAARDWTRQAKATIAAKQSRILHFTEGDQPEEEEEYQTPPPRKCALCGAPEDKVLLEDWAICWHCGRKLKGEV
jgi:ParB family chromosome partitioning protein